MQEYVVVKANKEHIRYLMEKIEEINQERQQYIEYSDFDLFHTKSTITDLLNGDSKNEFLYIVQQGAIILGFVNFVQLPSDYMFFLDSYTYIKYFHLDCIEDTDEWTNVYMLLNDMLLQISKKNNIKYICGDIYSEDERIGKIYKNIPMFVHRNRLFKKLVK